MNVLGILLQPLDWQRNHSQSPIDPMGVKFDTDREYDVFFDFNALLKLGRARVEITGNGGLYATMVTPVDPRFEDLILGSDGHPKPLKLAVGVWHDDDYGPGQVQDHTELLCIGLCELADDDNQPAVEVVQ